MQCRSQHFTVASASTKSFLTEFGACEKEYEGEHRWTARDRTVITKMEQYLKESDNMKVEVEDLELLLGPEDSEVDIRYILMNARRKKGRRISQIFSSKGPSDFLVVNSLRWEKEDRKKRGDGRKDR